MDFAAQAGTTTVLPGANCRRGHVERIALTDGHPVPAKIVIRAPEIDSRHYAQAEYQNLVVNSANGNGIFGGLALNISINPDATQIKNIIYTEK